MSGNPNSGRKKLPAEVLELRGTAVLGRPRSNGLPAKKITSIQQCILVEGYRGSSELAKKFFRTLCHQLMDAQILQRTDLPELLILAQEYELAEKCYQDIMKRGNFIARKSESGKIVGYIENPSVRMRNKHLANIKAFGSNFGLSPVDRQRIRQEVTSENPVTNIFNFINGSGDDADEQ